MIPVKLRLQNFMAYKTPETLDFTDLHVACLAGDNGAGKSTLLDAMTWALWGRARTRQDDDLIHLGQTDMDVEFTFCLAQETYRVLRRRSSAKRGKSELHFHSYAPDAGGWRTLTEGSIRQTQAKINRLLRLDYDTFINSAFLLQGRADEFTTKKPAERKQILGDILGLGMYDEYEEKAAALVRSFEQEVKILQAQLEQMEREMTNEPAYRAEWESGQKQAAALNKTLHRAEARLNDLRRQHQELELKQRHLQDLQTRLQQARTDGDELERAIAQTQQKIDRYQTIIAQQDAIKAGHRQLQQAQTEQADWNRRLAQSSTLSAEQHRLETAINRATAELEAAIRHTETTLNDLRPKAAAIPGLQTTLNNCQAQLNALDALRAEQDANRDTLNALIAEAARLEEENNQLRREMDTIQNRLTQLNEAGPTCPVCTQPLNETHRAAVQQQFTADGKARGDAFRANQTRSKEITRQKKTLTNAIKAADRELAKRAALQTRFAKTEQTLQDATAAAATIVKLEADLSALQQKLAGAEFEPDARAELARVQAQLAELGYDPQAHRAAETSVAELAHFADDLRRLKDAQAHLQEEETRLQQETARRQRLLAQTAADRDTVAQLAAETETLSQIAADLTAADLEVDDLQRQERLARDAVAAARQKLDHLAYLAKERSSKEEKLAHLKETQTIYQELRAAFGKKGVQALLIEHAIPELETEANQILARMTDGRVNLQFITQRAAKTTDTTIETLDIRIADELGTRNYDLYSGGEAFRVNFAIRIALSKVLARRAGASLQTLVMDEGFGTQDAQGRERLVEAINAIQSEFERIIVITHIAELQDAFPTRITVQKTDEGSRIFVL